ncbi:MAG: hypothetical protein NVSMB3_10090 [Acidobacteriaceae bacterium]
MGDPELRNRGFEIEDGGPIEHGERVKPIIDTRLAVGIDQENFFRDQFLDEHGILIYDIDQIG